VAFDTPASRAISSTLAPSNPFAQEDGLGAFDHLIELAALPDLSFCVHGRPLPLRNKR
jgi:hypothetical protein